MPTTQPDGVRPAARTRGRLRSLLRDWRLRTLLPLVLVNLCAFAGLYALMYHFAVSNLVQTYRANATGVFDEMQIAFEDMMGNPHAGGALRNRIARQSQAHGLTGLHVYDSNGRILASAKRVPAASEVRQIREVLASRERDVSWFRKSPDEIVFSRAIPNMERCQTCHRSEIGQLGALQISFDVTAPMAQTVNRVRQKFAIAGVAWLSILAALFWIGRTVIGRPLANIERSIAAAGSPSSAGTARDLDRLAARLDETIWDLINTHRTREENITRHMARAEQLAALGQVAAGLTHEIKNPLAGVIAAIECLRDDPRHGEDGRLHEDILSELHRVTGTLDSLLRLARPQPPERTASDLGRIIDDLTNLFAPRFRRSGIALEKDISSAVPRLPLDPGLMSQLLVNLLTNAMQATPWGGVVKVVLTPFPRHDGAVLIVADSGCGIGAEQLDRIFDPFFTTKEEGTGLGLPICKQIVEQHGGTINVDSEVGRGTKVVVLLPHPDATRRENADGASAAG